MAKVMMTVQSPTPPSLADLQERFQLQASDLDAAFGIIEIDPDLQLYSFMVEESKSHLVTGMGNKDVQGPYSNPKIETFGLPPSPNSEQ